MIPDAFFGDTVIAWYNKANRKFLSERRAVSDSFRGYCVGEAGASRAGMVLTLLRRKPE